MQELVPSSSTSQKLMVFRKQWLSITVPSGSSCDWFTSWWLSMQDSHWFT